MIRASHGLSVAALVCVCALAITAPRTAHAHANSTSWIDLVGDGRTVTARVRIAALDLNEAVGAPPGAVLSADDARRLAPNALPYLRARLGVSNAGARCEPDAGDTAVHPRDDRYELHATLRFTCPRSLDALAVNYGLFFDVDPRHRGIATVRAFGRTASYAFTDRNRSVRMSSERSTARQLASYVELGAEHIALGYDHLAFLAGLLLALGEREMREALRGALRLVTSFTAAHSLTLVGAALGWFTAPASLVEPAIAASIAWIAVENLSRSAHRHRAVVTFAFGLVHGFGFADVLAEQGLPARATAASLLAFNGGVELGQLAFMAVAAPLVAGLVWAAGRDRYRARVLRPASLVLAAFAMLWFVERVTGWRFAGGRFG